MYIVKLSDFHFLSVGVTLTQSRLFILGTYRDVDVSVDEGSFWQNSLFQYHFPSRPIYRHLGIYNVSSALFSVFVIFRKTFSLPDI